MKHIDERILLLGLVVDTIPYEYKDNNVSASLSSYIEISELKTIKSDLEELKNKEFLSDEEKTELSDEIHFIDRIIQSLEMR